jgi:hypothetical protein
VIERSGVTSGNGMTGGAPWALGFSIDNEEARSAMCVRTGEELPKPAAGLAYPNSDYQSDARRILEKMQKRLAQMTAAHIAAEEYLSKLTVDEGSVEKVVRDTPM